MVEKHYRVKDRNLPPNKLLEIAIGVNDPHMVQKILDDDRKEASATTSSPSDKVAADLRTRTHMLSALQLALERQAGARANRNHIASSDHCSLAIALCSSCARCFAQAA